ncbi:MAG: epoxyalkane--coenzyme transferase [Hyphomicrobiales bacterium]|nr:epoxyalkane--coenzyme transferase [Hyphomicrobiales bacterium]
MPEQIRTTHVGSLPRPVDLIELLRSRHENKTIDEKQFQARCHEAVAECVAKQVECGIDYVSDGEMSKVSYAYYVQDRLIGMEAAKVAEASGAQLTRFQRLQLEYPEFADFMEFRAKSNAGPASVRPPICTGPLSYRDTSFVETDIDTLKQAAQAAGAYAGFMTAASPGVVAMFASASSYYTREDDYVFGLADALRPEYEAIVSAGLVLQIDCPDLPLTHRMKYLAGDVDPMRIAARNIEAINIAIAGLPADKIRIHLCWGNYAGPHTDDVEVKALFPVLRNLKARGLSFEAANPRHAHEWSDWKHAGLADDMVLIPGVIDSVSNFVEHPRLIAERISRFADIVGADRLIAGADCGFGTFATGNVQVFPSIVWAKLRALREGAEIASKG